jgi:hypothetical protein
MTLPGNQLLQKLRPKARNLFDHGGVLYEKILEFAINDLILYAFERVIVSFSGMQNTPAHFIF